MPAVVVTDVVRLQVSINDPVVVQVPDHRNQLAGYCLDLALRQLFLFIEDIFESPLATVHNVAVQVGSLKRAVGVDQERVGQPHQDVLLAYYVLHHLVGDLALLEHLHREDAPASDVLHFVDLGKAAFTQLADDQKIGDPNVSTEDILFNIEQRADSLGPLYVMGPRVPELW